MSNGPTTVRMHDGLEDLLEAGKRASQETADVPSVSKSQLTQLLLYDAGDRFVNGQLLDDAAEAVDLEVDPEDLVELIPDHRLAEYYREEIIDHGGESWYVDMKEGFEGRVRDQLGKRFERGYSPKGIERKAESFVAEAERYWLRIEDDPDTFDEKRAYVRQVVEDLTEQHELRDWDPHEEWLNSLSPAYGDAETPITEEAIDEDAIGIVTDVIPSRVEDPDHDLDRLAISRRIADEAGVSQDAGRLLADVAPELYREWCVEDDLDEADDTEDGPDVVDRLTCDLIDDAREELASGTSPFDAAEELEERGVDHEVANAAVRIATTDSEAAAQGGVPADD